MTILFNGYSTIPCARAAFSFGMRSRTVRSSMIVLSATHDKRGAPNVGGKGRELVLSPALAISIGLSRLGRVRSRFGMLLASKSTTVAIDWKKSPQPCPRLALTRMALLLVLIIAATTRGQNPKVSSLGSSTIAPMLSSV